MPQALLAGGTRPMDVEVHWIEHVKRSLSAAKPSLLGDGLLERARSTTLALLGVTAAVGLAVVALVLQQGWPLVSGSPLPGLPGEGESVEPASQANAGPRPVEAVPAEARPATAGTGGAVAATDRGASASPDEPANLAVTDSARAGSGDAGTPPAAPGNRGKDGQSKEQPAAAAPPAAAVTQPVARTDSSKSKSSSEATQSSSPPAASSASVEEDGEDEWPWSNGNAYGHDRHDHDRDYGRDDGGDDHHGWGHDHGHGWGHDKH